MALDYSTAAEKSESILNFVIRTLSILKLSYTILLYLYLYLYLHLHISSRLTGNIMFINYHTTQQVNGLIQRSKFIFLSLCSHSRTWSCLLQIKLSKVISSLKQYKFPGSSNFLKKPVRFPDQLPSYREMLGIDSEAGSRDVISGEKDYDDREGDGQVQYNPIPSDLLTRQSQVS